MIAELGTGNAIIRAGVGHPAPPAGDMIQLAGDLLTVPAAGIDVYARNTSTHHAEITDAARFNFILTAPHPPPPPPNMDAIRTARACEVPVPTPDLLLAPGTIEMDFRGEMRIYHEANRRTDMIWTWSEGNHFYRSSLTSWWYAEERRSVPMTVEEKEAVLEKFLHYGRTDIGSNIHVVD